MKTTIATIEEQIARLTGVPVEQVIADRTRWGLPPSQRALDRIRVDRARRSSPDLLTTRPPGWIVEEAAKRRAERLRAAVEAAYATTTYRRPQSLTSEVVIHTVVCQPGQATVKTTTAKSWRRRLVWRVDVTLHVPCDWTTRVEAQGLAVIDGLLTLDAEPVHSERGGQAWTATWVVQGRGYSLRVRRGIVYRHGADNTAVHAATLAAARRTRERDAR